MKSLLFASVAMCLTIAVKAAVVSVAWDEQQDADAFRVWRGIELLATVQTNSATIRLPDGPCVLTVTALNPAGESAHSEPLHLIAVSIEESEDLRSWRHVRTVHRARRSAGFFRLKIQTGEGAP